MSSGESGSIGPGANDTVSVASTAVAKSAFEVRSPGIAKFRAATAAEAVDTTVAKSVVEAPPPGFAKYSAVTAAPAVAEAQLPQIGLERTGFNNVLLSMSQ